MTPYYQDETVAIYHGDCRNILPAIGLGSRPFAVVSDPVWPNATAQLVGASAPAALFRECLRALAPLGARRAAFQLGCDSDPAFLDPVAPYLQLEFFRLCWLRYAVPSRKGRLLMGSDVAYLYGPPPPSAKGLHLIGGEATDSSSCGKETAHPTPRKLAHVSWLVSRWTTSGETVLDPFAGSGTTLLAALNHGRRAIGIEIVEAYCEMAAARLSQRMLPLHDPFLIPN